MAAEIAAQNKERQAGELAATNLVIHGNGNTLNLLQAAVEARRPVQPVTL